MKNVNNVTEMIEKAVEAMVNEKEIFIAINNLFEEYKKIMPTLSDSELKEELAECKAVDKIMRALWWDNYVSFDTYKEISDISFEIYSEAKKILRKRERENNVRAYGSLSLF